MTLTHPAPLSPAEQAKAQFGQVRRGGKLAEAEALGLALDARRRERPNDTLACAFALCLPVEQRRRLTHQEERPLLGADARAELTGSLREMGGTGTYTARAHAWTLTRLGEGE